MKIASASVPVYSKDGGRLIGQLECGEGALVLSESGAGAVIAYIMGLVKKQDCAHLVEQDEWSRTADEVDKFLAYAASQTGCLYVSGGQGQKMTPALIRKLEKGDSNYKRALKTYEKNLKANRPLTGYDCSGLIIAYLLGNKLITRDLTAHGIYYTICDRLDKDDICGGDLVFKKKTTSSRIYHAGIYMGDGTVVQAKGRDYGVVREPFSATGWNRFGRLKVFANGRNIPNFTRVLKKVNPRMMGDDIREAQKALLSKGHDPKGIDGAFGPNTEKAVISFQKAANLKADGIITRDVWDRLMMLV